MSDFSMQNVYETIRLSLQKGDLNHALFLIIKHVNHIITEPLCTAKVFGAKELDHLCQEIGKQCFEKYFSPLKPKEKVLPSIQTHVYIATKLQKTGGHTRVLEDLILENTSHQHIILVTELSGSSDKKDVTARFNMKNIHIYWAPSENYLGRLLWLQKMLLKINPCDTYLFNHHQDSVAIAAVQPQMKHKLFFYHHGDHHFCLGLYLKEAIHIDPHPMGYYNCRYELGINNNIYYPLVINDQGVRKVKNYQQDLAITTCTVGNRNKIEQPYFINYAEFVSEIIHTTQGKHIHIGRLSTNTLKKIRKNMQMKKLTDDYFIYLPSVKSVWQSLHFYQVDLYIASFPYGGARTLVEVLGSGTPIAIHDHCESNLLSCIEMSYENTFVWRYPHTLLAYLSTVSKQALQQQGEKARKHYLTFYHKSLLQQAMRNQGKVARPIRIHHSIDQVESSLNIANQFMFSHVVRRWVKKMMKSLHAKSILWMKKSSILAQKGKV